MAPDPDAWRHACGCVKTSEKLRQILKSFPEPPPPSPTHDVSSTVYNVRQTGAVGDHVIGGDICPSFNSLGAGCGGVVAITSSHSRLKKKSDKKLKSKHWKVITQLVDLVQFSVTATALAIYYLIYCYMQLIYYTLRSAVFFHQADGPMKISIAVVTITSVLVGLHILTKVETLIGISPKELATV